MKKRRIFYNFRYMENPVPYLTRKGWLRYKDKILNVNRYNFVNINGFGIKLQPKHKHRRSIAVRSLKQLYGFTVSDLLLPIEFPERFKFPHGIGYKQYRGRRLYVF